MAQKNGCKSENRYESITIDLENLVMAKSRCEEYVDVIGTDGDTLQFRQLMTLQIRTATQLCRSIKSNFNKISNVNNNEIQKSQQNFISLHTELKEAVSRIKVKIKQFEPKKLQQINGSNMNDDKMDKIDKKEEQRMHDDEYEKDKINKLQQDLDDIKQVYCDLNELKSKQEIQDINNPDIVIKEILNEGWLDKQSRYIKSWRKRWVVFDKNTEDITLFTFKKEKEYINPTEIIVINDDIEIQQNYSTENEFILYNKSTKTKIRFKATDRENRKLWIQILQHNKNKDNTNYNPIVTAPKIQKIQNIIIHQQHHQNDVDVSNIHNHDISNNNDQNDDDDDDDDDINNNNDDNHSDHDDVEDDKNIKNKEEKDVLYDRSNSEVQDCLVLIDDLTHLRDEEDADSENNQIISDFENSLNEKGYVTKDQIDKLRDVSIKLIGFMFDQSN